MKILPVWLLHTLLPVRLGVAGDAGGGGDAGAGAAEKSFSQAELEAAVAAKVATRRIAGWIWMSIRG